MRFRSRLFLFYIIAVGMIALILAAYFINFEEKRVLQTLHEQLAVDAKLIAGYFEDHAIFKNPAAIARLVRKTRDKTNSRITVVANDGKVLGDSNYDFRKMVNHRNRPEIKQAFNGREGFSSRYSETLKENLIYVAYPITIEEKIVGVIRVAKIQTQLNNLLTRIKLLIVGGIIATALLALIFGILALPRITKPILELQQLAAKIAHGDLSARVGSFGHDEVADLGRSFNIMAEKLAVSFADIRNEKWKLEVILANLADGILVIDSELKIILANASAQNLLGMGPDFQGRPVMEAVLNHHLLELIQKVNLSKTAFESELNLHYLHQKQLQILLAPLKDESGQLAGSIVVLHDLTRVRRLERVRQDFVANVSHELRTPITGIKAMTETLLGGGWQDQEISMRYLRSIDQEVDRMANLINDLLALAKLDSKPVITKEPFDFRELVVEIKERFLPVSPQSPALIINLPDNLPRITANRDQIKQVLINLLDNAFKYTPGRGKVTVTAEQEGTHFKVKIADTGIGIPEEDQDRIFERFYRVDKARSREMGGTGLGLSIVKNIIESHGGVVEVESVINHGSIFSFTLPVRA